jgi:hypothetical protein
LTRALACVFGRAEIGHPVEDIPTRWPAPVYVRRSMYRPKRCARGSLVGSDSWLTFAAPPRKPESANSPKRWARSISADDCPPPPSTPSTVTRPAPPGGHGGKPGKTRTAPKLVRYDAVQYAALETSSAPAPFAQSVL